MVAVQQTEAAEVAGGLMILEKIAGSVLGAVLRQVWVAIKDRLALTRAKQSGADAATNAGRDEALRRANRRQEIDEETRDLGDDELDDRLRRPERRNNTGTE